MILPHLPIPLACGVPCAADTAQGDAERVGCSVLTTPGRRQRVVGVSATGVPCLLHAMRGPMAVAAPWGMVPPLGDLAGGYRPRVWVQEEDAG